MLPTNDYRHDLKKVTRTVTWLPLDFAVPSDWTTPLKQWGKNHEGGVCFYVKHRCCNNLIVQEEICRPDTELLSISLCPFYLPREFFQQFFTLLYIHPRANASAATQLIVDLSHKPDSLCNDATKFYLGDLNHVRPDGVLQTYEQYLSFPR